MQKELIINGLKYVLVEDEPIYNYKGLMWTKTFAKMSWNDAVDFCKNLTYGGYSDWRLASRMELESLLNLEKSDPACDIPDTISSSYWTSTTYAGSPEGAWYVNFNYGHASYSHKDTIYCVRAVRG